MSEEIFKTGVTLKDDPSPFLGFTPIEPVIMYFSESGLFLSMNSDKLKLGDPPISRHLTASVIKLE